VVGELAERLIDLRDSLGHLRGGRRSVDRQLHLKIRLMLKAFASPCELAS
jgi:hypothetical protein